MTFLVKCDGCGKIQEAGKNVSNPFDNVTAIQWYSRRDKNTEKWQHACSRQCIKEGLVCPL